MSEEERCCCELTLPFPKRVHNIGRVSLDCLAQKVHEGGIGWSAAQLHGLAYGGLGRDVVEECLGVLPQALGVRAKFGGDGSETSRVYVGTIEEGPGFEYFVLLLWKHTVVVIETTWHNCCAVDDVPCELCQIVRETIKCSNDLE